MSVPLRFRIVRFIALKELLESLRDRRTLFMMIFVPMLLYPVLLLVLTQVASIRAERLEAQTSTVAVQVEPAGAGEGADADRTNLQRLIDFLDDDEALEVVRLETPHTDAADRARVIVADDDEARGGDTPSYDAIVTWIPPPDGDALGTARLEIDYESIEDRSRKAVERLETRLDAWSEAEVARRLEARGLPASLARPVVRERRDLSDSAQRGGFLLGAILPMLVVITVLLGAFYPAIDLTAGEKERGSIQTLFAAPISVLEIVAGKYLAVVCIALISGTANLVSMGLMFGYVGSSMLGGAGGAGVELGLTPQIVAVLFVIIVLIAIFFAALVLAVAVLARDFKDGQNLLTPVFMLAMVPGMIAQMPGFELTVPLTMVPGVNVILLMKQVLIDGVQLQFLFLVAASSVVTTGLALVVAAHFFGQERVMVGERGRFDLLARPSQIQPRDRPSVSEALAWFCVAFLLLFYLGTWVQGRDLIWGVVVTLWGFMLLPTLGVARYLKVSFRETFALRRPPGRALLAAALMGPTVWIVVDALNRLVDLVLPVPPDFVEGMAQAFAAPDSPLGWVWFLFVFAVTPGICEELLFRGFVMSSLRGRLRPWTVILVSAVMFGLLHLSIYRLFGTTALGVVMGILAYQSRSIFPSMLFHALNNATVLLATSFLLDDALHPPLWLVAPALAALGLGLALVRRPASQRSSAR